jgi:hypothetical protein
MLSPRTKDWLRKVFTAQVDISRVELNKITAIWKLG